jgi:hypothetical protein
MRTYENRNTLEAEMRTGGSHLTSLNSAVRALAEPTTKEGAAPPDNSRAAAPRRSPVEVTRAREQELKQDERKWRAERVPYDVSNEDAWIKAEIAAEEQWIKARSYIDLWIKVRLEDLVEIRKALRDGDKSFRRNESIVLVSLIITSARDEELDEQERERTRALEDGFWRQLDELRRRLDQMRTGTSATLAENLRVLGLVAPVTRDRLRAAYLSLAKTHHPDCGGSTAEFLRVQRAYEEASRQMPGAQSSDP